VGVDALVRFVLTAVAEVVVFFAGFDEGVFLLVDSDGLGGAGLEVVGFGLGLGTVFDFAGGVPLPGLLVQLLEAGHRPFDAAVPAKCLLEQLVVLLLQVEVPSTQILDIDVQACVFLGVSHEFLGLGLASCFEGLGTAVVG
jgi:hypothetical protein